MQLLKFMISLNLQILLSTQAFLDGSWQKRGYSSLNGYVAVLSMESGKDIEVMSRFCRLCDANKNLEKTDSIAFENFKANHSCSANYEGSAPNMEVMLLEQKEYFHGLPIGNQKLRYVEMYSDGDSQTYPAIKDTYVNSNDSDIEIQKKECVGHVEKRVGTRLRKLKKVVKGLKSKLTEKVIERLQNFYGIAIRSNPGNLKGMQDNVMTVMGHVASSEKNCWHDKCPKGNESLVQIPS